MQEEQSNRNQLNIYQYGRDFFREPWRKLVETKITRYVEIAGDT
jgi:hypothetical protein